MLDMSNFNSGLHGITSVLLMVILITFALPVFSGSPEKIDEEKSVFDSLTNKPSIPLPAQDGIQSKESESPTITEVWCEGINDNSTRESCLESYRSSFNYYKTGHEHRAKVFAWQFFSARIIFFVVLTLVAVGIYFAWVQFKTDMGAQKNDLKKDQENQHTLELSPSSVKVSSPVLGVIILVLSLAFFYLYLVFVYPIAEIF